MCNEDNRKIIGYRELNGQYEPIFEPRIGSIVTQAFILCKECGGSVYHCMGPKFNSICLSCFDKKKNIES